MVTKFTCDLKDTRRVPDTRQRFTLWPFLLILSYLITWALIDLWSVSKKSDNDDLDESIVYLYGQVRFTKDDRWKMCANARFLYLFKFYQVAMLILFCMVLNTRYICQPNFENQWQKKTGENRTYLCTQSKYVITHISLYVCTSM